MHYFWCKARFPTMASCAETKDNSQTIGNMETVFDFSVSDFATLVTTTAFVDKTMMIKDFFSCSSRSLITVPPRFGKSTNIDMVKRFLEIEVDEAGKPKAVHITKNYQLFKDNNLEICKHDEFFNEHFGKHPVIYIDCEPLSEVHDFVNMLEVFRTIVTDSFIKHSYLFCTNSAKSSFCFVDDFDINDFRKFVSDRLIKDVDASDLMCSFKYLSTVLYRYFGKEVFVLIDDYDAFVNSFLFRKNNPDTHKMISFIKTTIGNLLKSNRCVGRALLTGVLPVTGDGFPHLGNNMDCYYFLDGHPFCKYYGLTSNELDNVLEKLVKDEGERNEKKKKIDEPSNGYLVGNQNIVQVYSIWSVLQYLCRRKVQNYWCSHGYIGSYKPLFKYSQIRDKVEHLLSGNELQLDTSQPLSTKDVLQLNDLITSGKVEDVSSSVVDTFFNMLYHLGYLSISKDLGRGSVTLKIPNEEIKRELTKVVIDDQTNQTLYDIIKHDEDACSATESFPELVKILEKLIKNDEGKNDTERTIDEYYNGYSEENRSGQTYSIRSVIQYLRRKQTPRYSCIRVFMTSFKPLFGDSQIRDKVEQLLLGNELQLDTSQLLSTEDVLQLNDIITSGKVEDISSSVMNTFFVLLYYFGYLSISKVLDRRFVYLKIPIDEITSELANVVFETNKWLYCPRQEYVDNVRSAVGSFRSDRSNIPVMFNSFNSAISDWCQRLRLTLQEISDTALANGFLTHLFITLVTTPENSQTVVRNLGPNGPVVILLKNKHQVAVCITAQRDTSDPPSEELRRWSAADAHKSVTGNSYEENVFGEYNESTLRGKVLIGIGYHMIYRQTAITYSYYFKEGDNLRNAVTLS